ncbi:MAG: hypothetical protein J5497_02530, partial [Selenomonadaceae bacterium]|nr:hypothetical protein [Selenomonadaceae bacterium]
MEKKEVILVVLNRDALEDSVKKLNLNNANLKMIFTDGYERKTFNVGGNEIPVTAFAMIHEYLWKYRYLIWLISGGTNTDNIRKMKKFLMTYGRISEKNIINFNVAPQISGTWLANLRHIEKYGADYFVTGNEYTQVGLNLNFIPRVHADTAAAKGGVILADANQTLRQSCLTAKHVFKHVKPGTIKFVLIGLTPDIFFYNSTTNFPHALQNHQYAFALDDVKDTAHDSLVQTLSVDNPQNILAPVTAKQADLNFGGVKATFKGEFSAK